MRIAASILAALALAGCGSDGARKSGNSTGKTELELSFSAGGETPTKIWTLSCSDSGTPTEPCRSLEALDDPFAPPPKQQKCTQIYGGPQTADVRGLFKGRRIKAHFSRGDGCEIARWNRVEFLFPKT